ncbi:hypothetical protein GCM10025867_47760 (plasmid) [Frondihabitans sucicola]|uniref:Helicase ATP-binding domain-containing protein n=1 Tax=Frondihabitans sucicola TaxID=1268041 RepID=A0ABM8GVN7_9MICO|nr:ATP-dependent DNA helicase [Frondihabitans sucicola]BDZ52535.1 hypothetical protein GCM10025867_47760 [Frondihabitans sucicola]
MSVAADEVDPKIEVESEYTVTDTLAEAAAPERDPLKSPETPDEAADKAEYILAILVKAKNGRTRPSQVQMARAVAMSLFGQRPLLVEGPTGTGKSLAYLAGALAFGKQTVVATHTKALQDQLKLDLELLMGVLDSHLELWADEVLPTYAILKGRGAYACLDRLTPRDIEEQAPLDFDDPSQASPSSAVGAEVQKLHDWAKTTDSGDRTDIPFRVSEAGWRAISVTADQCTSKRCRFFADCFAEKAKQKATTASIIIANQALLAMSMRLPILAAAEAIVVDEAHEFESVVASTFGTEVTIGRLENAVKRAGVLDAISAKTAASKRDKASLAIAALSRLVPVPKPFVNDRSILPTEAVVRGLKSVREAFLDLREFTKSYPIKNDTDQGKKEVLTRQFANIVSDIDILLMGTTDTQVAWVERNPRTNAAVMKSAMFEVSEIIRERLIKEHRSVVFTSATLTIAGKFDSPIRTLGFEGTPYTTLAVESPFDFQKQGRLYHPMGIPFRAELATAPSSITPSHARSATSPWPPEAARWSCRRPGRASRRSRRSCAASSAESSRSSNSRLAPASSSSPRSSLATRPRSSSERERSGPASASKDSPASSPSSRRCRSRAPATRSSAPRTTPRTRAAPGPASARSASRSHSARSSRASAAPFAPSVTSRWSWCRTRA